MMTESEPPTEPIDWGKSEVFYDGSGWLFAIVMTLTWAATAILVGVLIGFVASGLVP